MNTLVDKVTPEQANFYRSDAYGEIKFGSYAKRAKVSREFKFLTLNLV